MTRLIKAATLATLAAAMLTIATPDARATQTGADLSRCGTSSAIAPDTAITTPATKYGLQEAGVGADPLVLDFGRRRSDGELRWNIDLLNDAPEDLGDVSMYADFPNISGASLLATGTMSSNGEVLRVTLCVDPTQPRAIPAGEYRGIVEVDDKRFGRYERAVVLRLQYTPVALPLVAVVIAAAAGAGWQWITSWTGLSKAERKLRSSPAALKALSIAQAELAAGVTIAMIVSMFTVFVTSYVAKPAWDWTWTSVPGLALIAFSSGAASYGLVGLASGFLRPTPPDEDANGGNAADDDSASTKNAAEGVTVPVA